MIKYKFFDDNILFDYGFLNYAIKYNLDISIQNIINVRILELINIELCIVCSKKTYYLGHCTNHIKEVNVDNLYKDLINFLQNI